MNRTNIFAVHCNHPIDVYYWLAGKVKLGHESGGDRNYYIGKFYFADENCKKLKDGNQVVNISWDQNYDDYLVVFRVEEEE